MDWSLQLLPSCQKLTFEVTVQTFMSLSLVGHVDEQSVHLSMLRCSRPINAVLTQPRAQLEHILLVVFVVGSADQAKLLFCSAGTNVLESGSCC
mmetsp:Transcript_31283/g.67334  ORF Transcript_31283/g.67334 Transcript_31283/m.67334 type:complete len:94 (-) Transcript_31283:2881-3162(-)